MSAAASKALAKLGFEPLAATKLVRMLASVESAAKCGKTHWALGAPEPIAYFNFDTGLEGVDQKFLGKEIMVYNFPSATAIDTQEQAQQTRDLFIRAYRGALGVAKTIVIDTGTECWEVFRLAAFGKLTQVRSHHYSGVNMEFKRLWRWVYDTPGQNLIMVHKLKPVYIGEARTGDLERAGFADADYDAQVIIRLWKEGSMDFRMRIQGCRLKPQLEGTELAGDMNCWDVLQDLVIGG